MRLPVKLSLLLAAATCFPLLLATAFTLPRGREALRSQLDEIYAQDARALAAEVHRSLVDKLDSLTLAASTLRLNELDPEAREQALLLIYQETRGADIVGLFDARADAVGNIIRFPRLQGVLASEHEAIDDAALSSYAGKVPLQGALQAGLAIGPVYVVPDVRGRPIPRLVLAVAVPGPRNTRWVVAVEISLRRLAESFERFRPGETGAAFLLDGENKIILHPDRQLMLKQASMHDHPLVKGGQNSEWLGANEPVPLLGWRVIVQESADEALRPLRHLARDAYLWLALGLLVAVLLGFSSVRTVTAPVQKLREAALAVTAGALETHVDVRRRDELGELADAFNTMTRGLRRPADDGAAAHPARRDDRRGLPGEQPPVYRSGRAPRAVAHAARGHGSRERAALRRSAAARYPRRPDQHVQPAPLHGPGAAPVRQRAPIRPPAHGDDARCRPLQADQRPPRASRWRPGAAGVGGAVPPGTAVGGRPRAIRRRGVRHRPPRHHAAQRGDGARRTDSQAGGGRADQDGRRRRESDGERGSGRARRRDARAGRPPQARGCGPLRGEAGRPQPRGRRRGRVILRAHDPT